MLCQQRASNLGNEGSLTVTQGSPSRRSGCIAARMAQKPRLIVQLVKIGLALEGMRAEIGLAPPNPP